MTSTFFELENIISQSCGNRKYWLESEMIVSQSVTTLSPMCKVFLEKLSRSLRRETLV